MMIVSCAESERFGWGYLWISHASFMWKEKFQSKILRLSKEWLRLVICAFKQLLLPLFYSRMEL